MKKIKKIWNNLIKSMKNNLLLSVLPVAVLVLIVGSIVIGIPKTILVVFIVLLVPFFMQYGGKLFRIINGKGEKGRKKKKTIFNIILNIVLIGVILLILASIGFIGYIVISAPEFNPNNLYKKEASTIYDAKGNEIEKLGTEIREKITFDQMPQVLIDAIVATEDSRFYQHNGFDLPRFLKASFGQALGNSGAGGASTITMQIVKNNFTSTKVSIVRKFTDIYMSIFKIERNYSKEEILEFYVNAPFLGANSYGVAEASRAYFGKEVRDLNLSEASLIAGLFQSPSYYDPFINPDIAEKRRSTVLYYMRKHGYITKEEEDIANAIPVKDLLSARSNTLNPYQSFIDTVVAEVEDKTEQSPYNIPMEIYTTLDTDKQDYLNRVTNGELFTWANDVVQTGIAVTNTKTGAMLAISGGRNINVKMGFNRATSPEMKKQPGSTAKPLFDYGPGVEYNNWSTYTPFLDDAYSYTNGPSIQDWDSKYMGLLTLKQSLGLSRNIPALKAFQQVENKDIVSFVTSLGIHPEVDNGRVHEAHALGAFTGVNPLQMAAAYASFGNGGYYIEPYSVSKIVFTDTNETKVYTPVKNKVMSDSTAYLITNALVWATDRGLSDDARVSGYQIAAKTGTTNFDDNTIKSYHLPSTALNDLWAIAYTPDVSVGLWYGYDKIDKNFVSQTADVTRKKRLFNVVMKGMAKGSTKTFKMPSSVATVEVEKGTIPAMFPSANTPESMRITEYFKKGTEPTEVSPRYQQLPDATGLNVEKSGGKLHISWNATATPTYFTSEGMKAFFDTYYGRQSDKYYQKQVEINNTELGTISYDIYYKGADQELHPLGTTTNTSFVADIPGDSGNLTFIVKTAFSIFKASASKGCEFTFTNEAVSVVEVNVVGGTNVTISIGSPYQESAHPITVLDNFIDVTSDATLISTVITKKPDNNVVGSIDTSTAGIYDVTYTVRYNGQNYTAVKTVTVQ